jgi:hypothetical protein
MTGKNEISPKNFLRYCELPALLLIFALVLVAPVGAAVITISPGQSITTAITSAGSGGTVILNPGIYSQHGISVGNAVTIKADTANGHGPWDTIIDGANSGTGIFTDNSGYDLSIDNLTMQNGVSTSSGGAIYNPNGIVTVTSSTFNGCSASSSMLSVFGGAIFARSVTVTSSTFNGCSASGRPGSGGAIDAGSVTVTSSTFNGCSAMAGGGAIYAGSVTVTSSSFNGCSASVGGAIGIYDSFTISSSTFTGCSAGFGGAIYTPNGGGTIHFCRIYQDSLATAVYTHGSSLDASDNWWGSNSDPSGNTAGGVITSPYLMLGISASPSMITAAGTSTISANLTYDSTGHQASGGTIANGTPVLFTSGDGTFLPETAITKSGVASTTFTPTSTGTAHITATIDGQSVTVPVTVTSGSSSATAIVIDPATTPATVYAGVDTHGIYWSNSGSWTPATTQPSNKHIRALVINPLDHTHLFAGTYGGGVNRSVNSGVDWGPCGNTGLANLNVLSLVSDSTGTLYAGTEAGVFTSTDCNTWTAQNSGLP